MKHVLMIQILLFAFGFGVILDFIMSVYGFAFIFEAKGVLAYALSGVFAFALISLKLCFETIRNRLKVPLFLCMYWSVWLAIFLDAFSIYKSITAFVIAKQPVLDFSTIPEISAWSTIAVPVRVVAIALIIFLVAAPIVLSYLLNEYLKSRE